MGVNDIKTFNNNTSISIFVNQGAQNVKFFIFWKFDILGMFGSAILEIEMTKILVQMQYKKGFIYYTKCV